MNMQSYRCDILYRNEVRCKIRHCPGPDPFLGPFPFPRLGRRMLAMNTVIDTDYEVVE